SEPGGVDATLKLSGERALAADQQQRVRTGAANVGHGVDEQLESDPADQPAHGQQDRAILRPTEAFARFAARRCGEVPLKIDTARDDTDALAGNAVALVQDVGERLRKCDEKRGAT